MDPFQKPLGKPLGKPLDTAPRSHHFGRRPGTVGTVHLNGTPVGTIMVTGGDTSWSFGRFARGPEFDPFAPAFELWSLLLHDGGAEGRLDRQTAATLAVVENAMDRIRARLFFPADNAWVEPVQLNIDGELLEWKEY